MIYLIIVAAMVVGWLAGVWQ
ncbi:hypothetical protein LCGC14_2578140, partial [marine sediment metagenome]